MLKKLFHPMPMATHAVLYGMEATLQDVIPIARITLEVKL